MTIIDDKGKLHIEVFFNTFLAIGAGLFVSADNNFAKPGRVVGATCCFNLLQAIADGGTAMLTQGGGFNVLAYGDALTSIRVTAANNGVIARDMRTITMVWIRT